MAALPAGVQYGLSSDSGHDGNKDLVFVKLTDSALRAIEDFLRNKGKFGTTPTIQFLPGNEGKISIPAAAGGGQQAAATFHFSLSSNADMDGPQGSFECVRGTAPGAGGARRLEACGPMPRRARVHANEDVYETTRHRMAADAEHLKTKCARVIKPNQTDIGRKIKVRQAPISGSGTVRPVIQPHRPVPSTTVRPISNGPVVDSASRLSHPAAVNTAGVRPIHPVTTAHPHQPVSHPNHQNKPLPGNPDVMKRPIKERLIQLLALRPYKKPELYARITSEGIRERERSVINTVLQQISCIKDNCYHLYRYIWNDVNEDWPFYSEEEKQILKRRKPQNLTPPLSSDSGHSGHSPSPRGSPSSASKRPPPLDPSGQPPQSKKQRISHYRKPTTPTQQQTGFLDSSLRRNTTLCSSPSGFGSCLSSGISSGASSGASSGERRAYSDDEPSHPLSNITSRDRDQFVPYIDRRNGEVKKDNNYTLSFGTAKDFCPSSVKQNGFRPSPPEDQISGFRPSPPENQMNGYRISPPQKQINGFRPSPPESQANGYRTSPPEKHTNGFRPNPLENQMNGFRPSPPENQVNGFRPSPPDSRINRFRPSPSENQINGYRTSPPEKQINGFRPSPPTDQIMTDQESRRDEMETDIRVTAQTEPDDEECFNDSLYPPIDSCARRRLYKAEFAELYVEYRELHKRVAAVASAFCALEARLKEAAPGSPTARVVQQQIVDEYKATQRDKRRFTYLHRKLAHIKRRVADYDNQQMSSAPAPTQGPTASAEAY